MKKIYCLDTNVLLNEPNAIFKFEDNDVVVSSVVIGEIDKFKKDRTEIGYAARQFSRTVDELRTKGNLTSGIVLNGAGGTFKVVLYREDFNKLMPFQDMSVNDNKIIATALSLKNIKDVILLSQDTNVRILSDIHGLKSEDYKNGKVESDTLYTGIQHLTVPQLIIDNVYKNAIIDISSETEWIQDEPYPNECFVLHADSNTKQSALCRYNSVMKQLKLLDMDMKTCDILPRNTEQTFALDLLKDENINLVSISSKAGAGKTLISLAAALHCVLETQQYSKIMLFKPIVSMDNSNELGFLPGSLEEKLKPWMSSYQDNIEVIMSKYIKEEKNTKKKSKKEIEVFEEKQNGKTNPMQELIAHGLLEIGSLEHLRGRSISQAFVIIDEIQNISHNVLFTILTRAGEGTKIVLLGDITQIDNPYLDKENNALSIVIDKMKEYDICGHITLRKSERSKLAELCSDVMNK